jgi:CubicO group peptidase (beta-lactamase class C family)
MLPLLLSLACGAAAQKGPGGAVVAGELGARIDQLVAKTSPSLWGVVLVARNGEPVFAKGYGLADRLKVPMTPACLFDLGGSSQQLTLLLALRLAAIKKVELGDSVGEHLADWPADRAAMTVQHLIDHTSGLSTDVPWGDAGMLVTKYAIAAFARAPLATPLGSEARYARTNANLLALVCEGATGARFEKLLVERVCKPFGMATAQPRGQRDAKNVTSKPSYGAGMRPEPVDRGSYDWSHRGATGVLASALDVHALLSAMTGGKLLTDDQLALLWKPFAGAHEYNVVVLPANGETIVRVHGTGDGYRAIWLANRSSRSWIVLLSDGQVPLEPLEIALGVELWQLAPPAANPSDPTAPAPSAPTVPPPSPTPGTPVAWAPAEIARFAGTFALPRGGGTLTIERCADGLRLCGAGLQASARVTDGAWPPPQGEEKLRAAEDRGLRVLERLLGTDASVERDAFANAGTGAAARRELLAWAGKHGSVTKTEYVGTTGADVAESWFRLVAKDRAFVRATWAADGKLTRLGLADGPPPFVAALAPVRADVAVATTASGKKLVLTMEGRGTARRLVFEDLTPGNAGLLECDLVAGEGAVTPR